jgi:hypothetical protein
MTMLIRKLMISKVVPSLVVGSIRRIHHNFNPIQLNMEKAFSDHKTELGDKFGITFEKEIQSMLHQAGYVDAWSHATPGVGSHSTTIKRANSLKYSLEFDATVKGHISCFDQFHEGFQKTFARFPPMGDHLAIVEVKLNHNLFKDWLHENRSGSRETFVSTDNYNFYCKLVVINGGNASEKYMDQLASNDPAVAQDLAIIADARLNIFYKPWLSNDAINDYFSQTKVMTNELQEMKSRLNHLEHILSEKRLI